MSSLRKFRSVVRAVGVVLCVCQAPLFAATITVDTLSDTEVRGDGLCSLREAIVAANEDRPYRGCEAGADADEIRFSVDGTIILNDDLPEITQALALSGPGTARLTLDGGEMASATHQLVLGLLRFRSAQPGERFEVTRMTLQRGGSGASPTGFGGGISIVAVEGSPVGVRFLTLEDVRVQDCSAQSGGAVGADGPVRVSIARSLLRRNNAWTGGAISINNGRLLITDSSISRNEARNRYSKANGSAGGISAAHSELVIRRSTFSGNVAESIAGAIRLFEATALLQSTTVVHNSIDFQGLTGSGVYLSGSSVLTMKNTVIASNRFTGHLAARASDANPDIVLDGSEGRIVTRGFNLVGVNEGIENVFPDPAVERRPNLHGDYVGTLSAPLDPSLGPLGFNGGSTSSHSPLAGSLVIDRGECTGEVADQRGFGDPETARRIVDVPGRANAADGCDIGAIEARATSLK